MSAYHYLDLGNASMMECQGALSCRRMTIVPASDIRRMYAPIAANLPFGSDMNMIMRARARACARQPAAFRAGLGDEDIKRG